MKSHHSKVSKNIIACIFLFQGMAPGAVTLEAVQSVLSTKVDLKLENNAYDAAQMIWFEIVQSWQQSEGGSGVTAEEIRGFKFYSSIEFQSTKVAVPKSATKLEICKEIVKSKNCQIVFDANGMHLIANTLKLDFSSYHALCSGVYFLKPASK